MVSSIFKEEGAARLHCSPFKLMAVLYGACQATFKSWNQSVTKGPSRYPSMREIRQQQPRGGSLSCKMLKRFSKHRKKPPSIIAQAHASSCSEGLRDMRRPVRPLGTHGAKCATGRNNRTRGTSMAVPWPCPTFKNPTTRYICHWGRRRKDWHRWWRVAKFTVLCWQYHPTFSVCRTV